MSDDKPTVPPPKDEQKQPEQPQNRAFFHIPAPVRPIAPQQYCTCCKGPIDWLLTPGNQQGTQSQFLQQQMQQQQMQIMHQQQQQMQIMHQQQHILPQQPQYHTYPGPGRNIQQLHPCTGGAVQNFIAPSIQQQQPGQPMQPPMQSHHGQLPMQQQQPHMQLPMQQQQPHMQSPLQHQQPHMQSPLGQQQSRMQHQQPRMQQQQQNHPNPNQNSQP